MAGHPLLLAGQFSFFESVQGRGNLFAVWVPFFLITEIKTIQTTKQIILAHGPDVETEQADNGLFQRGKGLITGDKFNECGGHDGGWYRCLRDGG
jgi:hypothetical protein